MSLLDASRQLTLSGLRVQRKPKIEGVRRWILSSSYRLEQPPRKKNVSLLTDGSTEIVEAFAYDISRFGSAAIETLQQLEAIEKRPLAIGWIIIRSYYSAYFAANTIMRLFGHFCTNLEQKHVASIHEMAHLYQVSIPSTEKARLSAGTFAGRYSALDGTVTLRSLHSIGGGAHKQFWFAFKEFLDVFDHELDTCVMSKSQLQEARNSVKTLLLALCQENHPNGNWLSEIRNAVNYRLEYGVWHPYDDNQILAKRLIATIEASFNGPPRFRITNANAHELSRSTDSCLYLFSWMLSSLSMLAEQSKGGSKHFVQSGPFALLM